MGRLDILYEKLDFKNGELYFVTDDPSQFKQSIDWLEKGEWLAAAKRAGAENIFFVDNNPVVVFAECDSGEEAKIKAFNRAWCLARPRLLFLASPGEISVYDGLRLLVKRGIRQKSVDKGRIISRLETDPFCFTNDIHGIKLTDQEEWKYKTILGILWSSAARYFFFMTAANWGLWHDEIHLDELLKLPIILDESNPATGKVISIVDKLRSYHPQELDMFHHDGVPREQIETQRREWETELDKAVFELYGLNEEQLDLIRDFCDVTLPFFYTPFSSNGADRAIGDNDSSWIEKYIHTFCRRWNTYLGDDEEMRAEIHIGAHDNIAALEFFPAEKNAFWNLETRKDTWSYILEQIGKALPQPMGTSQILSLGLVYIVSDPGIIIIKRNEKRFWTASLAREDADATICKRMIDTIPQDIEIIHHFI